MRFQLLLLFTVIVGIVGLMCSSVYADVLNSTQFTMVVVGNVLMVVVGAVGIVVVSVVRMKERGL